MSKERLVYLIRHAQPDLSGFGEGRIYLGHTDLVLSDKGIQSAKKLAETMKQFNFDSIYSSDLKRAIQTAEIISQATGKKSVVKSGFREINLGQWEGLSMDYVKSVHPLLYKQRGENLSTFSTPDGECFDDFSNNLWANFKSLLSQSKGDIVLVSHAGVNRAIICKILSIPLDKQFQIQQSYCCINILSLCDEKFKLKLINYDLNN